MTARSPSARSACCSSGRGSSCRTAPRSCWSASRARTQQGYAGLQDRVDYHWRSLVGAALLSTVLGAGAELGQSSEESELVRALRQSGQDSVNQTGQEIVRRQLNVQPTLTIRPGFPVRVIVNRDLVLAPYGS